MKKLFFFFLSALYLNLSAHAQLNLVPNPSFELYSSCPDDGGEVSNATGWDSFNTADYFHVCATSSDVQVPQNLLGYQFPATGSAYCGFFTYSGSSDYHEFIYTQLISSLTINQKYFISFKVSPADSNFCVYSNKTGVKFFKNPPGTIALDNTAQFYTHSIIVDTSGWTKIAGSFIADSTYKYVAFGNFFNDAHTDTIVGNCNFPFAASYYYIDDICISTDSLLCNSIVPINLLSFNVKNLNNTLNLIWKTAQEENNKGFEILRSARDASHFRAIGFVTGAGYSTTETRYNFTDKNLQNNTEYFYKLRQIDFDGKFSYSPIQKGEIDFIENDEFSVNPNPVGNELKIYFSKPIIGQVQIKLIDNWGRVINTSNTSNIVGQLLNINMQNLSPGLYFVQLIKGSETRIQKIIKL